MNRDSDSGRNSTDWTQWSVEHMWRVLHDEDPGRTFRHADAWYAVMQACARHRDRLFAFRDQLIHRWSGAAADVYVARLDLLITGLDQTTEAAYTTYRALHTMASAITVAREKMAPIYAQWQRLDSQEQDYQNQWWIAQVFSSDPVSAEQREALNRPAREVMRVASDAIFQSYVEMTPAPNVAAPRGIEVFQPISNPEHFIGLNPPGVASSQAQIRLPHLPTVPGWEDGPVLGGSTSQTGPPLPPGPSIYPGGVHDDSLPTPATLPANMGRQGSLLPGAALPSGNVTLGTPSNNANRSRPAAAAGSRAGGPAWMPTAPVTAPSATRTMSPSGRVIEGRGSTRSRRHSGESDNGVFIVDTSIAVPSILQPDPDPGTIDPGPAIGLQR